MDGSIDNLALKTALDSSVGNGIVCVMFSCFRYYTLRVSLRSDSQRASSSVHRHTASSQPSRDATIENGDDTVIAACGEVTRYMYLSVPGMPNSGRCHGANSFREVEGQHDRDTFLVWV